MSHNAHAPQNKKAQNFQTKISKQNARMIPMAIAVILNYNFNITTGSFKAKMPTQSFKPKTNTTKLTAENTKQKQ